MRHCAECQGSQADFTAVASDFVAFGNRALRPSKGGDARVVQLRERLIWAVQNQGLSVSDEAALGPQPLLENTIGYLRRAQWELGQWLPRVAIAGCVVTLLLLSWVLVQKLGEARNEAGELLEHASRAV